MLDCVCTSLAHTAPLLERLAEMGARPCDATGCWEEMALVAPPAAAPHAGLVALALVEFALWWTRPASARFRTSLERDGQPLAVDAWGRTAGSFCTRSPLRGPSTRRARAPRDAPLPARLCGGAAMRRVPRTLRSARADDGADRGREPLRGRDALAYWGWDAHDANARLGKPRPSFAGASTWRRGPCPSRPCRPPVGRRARRAAGRHARGGAGRGRSPQEPERRSRMTTRETTSATRRSGGSHGRTASLRSTARPRSAPCTAPKTCVV